MPSLRVLQSLRIWFILKWKKLVSGNTIVLRSYQQSAHFKTLKFHVPQSSTRQSWRYSEGTWTTSSAIGLYDPWYRRPCLSLELFNLGKSTLAEMIYCICQSGKHLKYPIKVCGPWLLITFPWTSVRKEFETYFVKRYVRKLGVLSRYPCRAKVP
jgi:hypothetical protein